MILLQINDRVKECILQNPFCNCQTLKLLHCDDLLTTFSSSLIKSLILLLNSLDLTFYFFLPIFLFYLDPLVTILFEFTNFFNFSLFFHFQKSLFNCFGQEYIENRLDFTIIIEKIIIFNLCNFISSSFLRNVRWSFWPRLKFISLYPLIIFFRLVFALFS
jgi:hypothetical protein